MGRYNPENQARSLPIELRAEQADAIIGDRIQNLFETGGVIYSNGEFGGFGTANIKVPQNISEELLRGRLVVCKASDIARAEDKSHIPWLDKNAHEPLQIKALVIPPGINDRFVYRKRELRNRTNPGIEVHLLQGIDENGNAVSDNLYHSYSFMRFFEKMAKKVLEKQGVKPNTHEYSYRRAVIRKLEEMTKEENGGMGDMNMAVEKMKSEMSSVAEEATKFINGGSH